MSARRDHRNQSTSGTTEPTTTPIRADQDSRVQAASNASAGADPRVVAARGLRRTPRPSRPSRPFAGDHDPGGPFLGPGVPNCLVIKHSVVIKQPGDPRRWQSAATRSQDPDPGPGPPIRTSVPPATGTVRTAARAVHEPRRTAGRRARGTPGDARGTPGGRPGRGIDHRGPRRTAPTAWSGRDACAGVWQGSKRVALSAAMIGTVQSCCDGVRGLPVGGRSPVR